MQKKAFLARAHQSQSEHSKALNQKNIWNLLLAEATAIHCSPRLDHLKKINNLLNFQTATDFQKRAMKFCKLLSG